MPPGPTVRAIALVPVRYLDREVRVTGRFRGRNLYGDLPQVPNKSKWDFVLQSADAAVWVTGMRPKGEGFDLDPGARVDTGRWLEVTGVVKSQGALLWIEASQMRSASAPTEVPVEIVVPDRPVEPPPRVVFSAPLADDIDVERAVHVRLQFSRIMDAATFRDRVRVTYVPRAGEPAIPPPVFTAAYNDGPRALEIKFAQPLERFQAVKVELLAGITAIDGQALPPWTLTFTTGS
jgi:Bacterial Ig-like domain